MRETWRGRLRIRLAAVALAGGAAVAGAAGLIRAGGPPDGPVPVVWDREACAHCRMLLSEPPFAAQLHTRDGQVLFYDDPGCLLLDLDEVGDGAVHAAWFRHVREDRWVERRSVAFARVTLTPMGFGLGAVDRAERGAVSFDEARSLARRAAQVGLRDGGAGEREGDACACASSGR